MDGTHPTKAIVRERRVSRHANQPAQPLRRRLSAKGGGAGAVAAAALRHEHRRRCPSRQRRHSGALAFAVQLKPFTARRGGRRSRRRRRSQYMYF